MSFARFINLAQSFKTFVNNTSKLPNKGNWKKLRLGKDTAFEFLCKLIIEKHPIFKKLEIEKIWHESEIPYREKKIINYPENLGDVGFDLLIKTKNNNYHAVQCKFRSDPKITLKIEKGSELATTFNLANVRCKNIKNIYVFATIDTAPKKIQLVPDNCIFILNSFFRDFDDKNSSFKWKYIKRSFKFINFKKEQKSPDKFQNTAVKNLKNYFKKNSRGCLFLPCGTGKTLISYWFANEMKYQRILILVPNLTLVSQILNNWVTQNNAKKINNKWLAVCSDKDVRIKEDPLVINTKDLPFDTTTENSKIKEFLINNKQEKIFIISTYNSSHKICSISKKIKFKFDLCIFDEAHKTVGTKDKLFSKALYEKNIKIHKRLFMTATKRQVQGHKDIIDMNNKKLYGDIAHEVSFKEAIEGNNPRLCNYKFKALGINKDDIRKLWNSNPLVRTKNLDSTTMKYLSALVLLFNVWKKYNLKKGITFHNSIQASEDFKSIGEQYQKYLNKKNDVQFFNISSKRELTGDKQSIISDFEKDKKSIITNARCLVEGVDVPAVDIVLFADKKRSRVDIVQAIGRCLRKSVDTGKKFGYVIVPFIFDKNLSPENLLKSDYKDVIKTIRILSLYDKTFAEDIKLQAKKGISYNGKVEVDLPNKDKLININKIKKAIRIENFKSTGPLNWKTFEDAKEYVKSKKIMSGNEYREKHQLGQLDFDLPVSPHTVYADEGFTTWGDFLGTGRIQSQQIKFRKFILARKFVRSLNLANTKKWQAYASSSKRPEDIPANPSSVYKTKWISWPDWLGKREIKNIKYRSFNQARKYARSLNLKSRKNWETLDELPIDIPKAPRNQYPKKWISWPDWLGTKNISPLNKSKQFLKFKDARIYARSLNLKSEAEWRIFSKSDKKPINIPADPGAHYKNKGWISWPDWLGTKRKKYGV